MLSLHVQNTDRKIQMEDKSYGKAPRGKSNYRSNTDRRNRTDESNGRFGRSNDRRNNRREDRSESFGRERRFSNRNEGDRREDRSDQFDRRNSEETGDGRFNKKSREYRGNRNDRFNREDRVERSERRDSEGQDRRERRFNRKSGEFRGNRNDRFDREDRAERSERRNSEGQDRREGRFNRKSREFRGNRNDRFNREDRAERSERRDSEGQDKREERFNRKSREFRGNRNERFEKRFDDEKIATKKKLEEEQNKKSDRFSEDGPDRETRAKKHYSKKKQLAHAALVGPKDGILRLNKYIANTGKCSRREADNLITEGRITVNDKVVIEVGTKVHLKDKVCLDGEQLQPEAKVYLALNKPKDFVTTLDDPQGRKTVIDLVKNACAERIYPVGRLDRMTTGVLLFTNDGDLTKRLTHPSFNKKKIYHVFLDREISQEELDQIAEGIELEDGFIQSDAISFADKEDHKQVGIEIHSGKNRIVRRIFEHFGYTVEKLDRVYFAGITKQNIPRGKWRFLSEEEVRMLKNF